MKIACIMEIHDVDDVVRLYDGILVIFSKKGELSIVSGLFLSDPGLT
jgi:hypothetical protein